MKKIANTVLFIFTAISNFVRCKKTQWCFEAVDEKVYSRVFFGIIFFPNYCEKSDNIIFFFNR